LTVPRIERYSGPWMDPTGRTAARASLDAT
jgi:hypothetical protein